MKTLSLLLFSIFSLPVLAQMELEFLDLEHNPRRVYLNYCLLYEGKEIYHNTEVHLLQKDAHFRLIDSLPELRIKAIIKNADGQAAGIAASYAFGKEEHTLYITASNHEFREALAAYLRSEPPGVEIREMLPASANVETEKIRLEQINQRVSTDTVKVERINLGPKSDTLRVIELKYNAAGLLSIMRSGLLEEQM